MPPQDAPAAQLQAALDLAPCGLLRTDTFGTVLRVNRTFCDWLGYPREELVGRKLQDLLTVGGRIFHQTHLHPLMQMQGSVSEVKLEFVRRDGAHIPIVFNARRYEEDGEAFSELALFVARDRDKYERELLQARRRLEAAVQDEKALQGQAQDRALLAEQMMGIVSHDLRNPLQTIQVGAVVLERTEASAQSRQVLGRIRRACERANRLICDMLDFTQARLGRGLAVQWQPMALHEAVADVLEDLRQAFEGRRIDHVQVGSGACTADPDRVGQLVGNLVRNALAYGRASTPVTVQTETGDGQWLVSVHNFGDPIPPELQAGLFRPMVRGTHQASASRSIGLGLYIVSEIAKALGGSVSVTSTAEAGTTFTLRCPAGRS